MEQQNVVGYTLFQKQGICRQGMVVDFEQFTRRFNEKAPEFKSGPRENRECTDIPCLILFFIVFFGTIGFGGYLIYQGKLQILQLVTNTGEEVVSFAKVMVKHVGPIVGMLVLSNALSVIFIFLSKSFPKCVFYTMMVLTFLIYIGMIIVGLVARIFPLAITFVIILLINALMLWCYWDYIQIGIKLIECASRFITEKPVVYVISLLCLLMTLIYTTFWIFGWVGISALSLSNSTLGHLSFVWYISSIFFNFFFYYLMVFLIASATAYWYYQTEETAQQNTVMKGFMNIRYHLGSIAFASFVITIITVMRILAQMGQSRSNGCLQMVACIMACLLSCLEELVKVLNHNAIIVEAITGEGYVDSAKSAIGLIFDNFGVFIIVDFFVDFMQLYATIFSVLIPAILGGVIIYQVESPSDGAITFAIYGAAIILLLALLLSSVVLGMLEEVLSAIFIFYSFDKKLRDMGVTVDNIPKEIKEVFEEADGNGQAQDASRNYLNGFNQRQ